MNAREIIRENLKNIPYKLDWFVAQGADGFVYELQDDNTKVIKISILCNYTIEKNLIKVYNAITDVYKYIQKNNLNRFVSIYDYGIVQQGERIFDGKKQSFIVHYCVMDKLEKLSKKDVEYLENNQEFWDELDDFDFDHGDLQIRNVLKDKNGNYKLIDFDRARMKGCNL